MSQEQAAAAVGQAMPQAVREARAQRADLHAVIVALEEALAAPAKGRQEEWAARVHDALVDLGAAFERHIAVTEGPRTLFDQIMGHAPRLASAVQSLNDEHQQIRTTISGALDTVRNLTTLPEEEVAPRGREVALALIDQLMRHRQAGADLVYEAYQVDIGVGD